MNLDAYDDMMGLEFGDYEMEGILPDAQQIKDALLAGSAGGGAILLTSWGVKKLNEKVQFLSKIEHPLLRSAVTSGIALMAGLIGGKMVFEYNRDAAIGIVGGVSGLAMANLLDTAIAQFTGNERMGISLGENDDESLLSGYGDDSGMAALAALEATGVSTAPGAFQGFSDPSVTPEALMGFSGLEGTVVQQETLGDMENYAPYLS
jgi:hypothetical protein